MRGNVNGRMFDVPLHRSSLWNEGSSLSDVSVDLSLALILAGYRGFSIEYTEFGAPLTLLIFYPQLI